MLSFFKRDKGHLYQESVRFPDSSGIEVSAILVADSLSKAKIVTTEGTELATGRLEYERGSDAGRPTRILVFVSKNGGRRYQIMEEYLSAGSFSIA